MLPHDAFGSLLLPLFFYMGAFNLLITHMKRNNMEEVADGIVYVIFLAGALLCAPVLVNYVRGVVIDRTAECVRFPFFLFFRRSLPLAGIRAVRREEKTYTRVGQETHTTQSFTKYWVALEYAHGTTRIVFSDPTRRDECAARLEATTRR